MALRALGDLHAMHRLLLQAFPDAEADEKGNKERVLLYRVERPRFARDLPRVLVQSEIRPAWEKRPSYPSLAGRGRALTELAQVDGPKEWAPRFTAKDVFRFRLLATPTVARKFGPEAEKPGRRRIGLYTEEEQRNWLERKGGDHGFTVHDLRITPLGKLSGRSPKDGVITHYGVEFDGLLQVDDPALFAAAIASGIGPAKGFGFGLLSLARE